MKTLIKYFIQGLIYVVPITVTLYVIWEAFRLLDNILPINVPGLGVIVVLLFVTIVGVVANHLISERLLAILERYLKKAPLISLIYTAVKDLMNAFVGKKKSFSKPVMVKLYENSEIRRLGFITNDNFKELGDTCDLVTVYIPHSYNISGNMYLVPESYVQPLKVNSSDLMKYSVSGGVTEIENLDNLDEHRKHTL